MYNTVIEFKKGFMEAMDYYREKNKTLKWLKEPNAEKAWEIYSKARKPTLNMAVMGRTVVDKSHKSKDAAGNVIKSTPMQPEEYGSAIDIAMHKNFGVNTHAEEMKAGAVNYFLESPNSETSQVGSIMHYYEANKDSGGWHFCYNDAWILGGVHSNIEFHLASPRTAENISESWGLTVTGRELVGLKTFGYQIRKTQLEEIAICINKTAAKNATFAAYIEAVEAVDGASGSLTKEQKAMRIQLGQF